MDRRNSDVLISDKNQRRNLHARAKGTGGQLSWMRSGGGRQSHVPPCRWQSGHKARSRGTLHQPVAALNAARCPPSSFFCKLERSPHLYFLEARSCLEVSLARIVLKSNQQQQQLSERSEKEKAQHRPQQSTHQIDNRDRQGRLRRNKQHRQM